VQRPCWHQKNKEPNSLGGYRHPRRVFAGYPHKPCRPFSDMAKGRERNVSGADPVALLRGVGKDALAVGFGLVSSVSYSTVTDGSGNWIGATCTTSPHTKRLCPLLSTIYEVWPGVCPGVGMARMPGSISCSPSNAGTGRRGCKVSAKPCRLRTSAAGSRGPPSRFRRSASNRRRVCSTG